MVEYGIISDVTVRDKGLLSGGDNSVYNGFYPNCIDFRNDFVANIAKRDWPKLFCSIRFIHFRDKADESFVQGGLVTASFKETLNCQMFLARMGQQDM